MPGSSLSRGNFQPRAILSSFCGNVENGPKSPSPKLLNKKEISKNYFSLHLRNMFPFGKCTDDIFEVRNTLAKGEDRYDTNEARERNEKNIREVPAIEICGDAPVFCGMYSKDPRKYISFSYAAKGMY